MTAGSRLDRSAEAGGTKRYYHLTLLAKNLEGYKNLIKLVSIANLEGYYYKPRMDKEILRKYSGGIIALSGCLGGELSQAVLKATTQNADLSAEALAKADDLVRAHRDIFGKEN